VPIIRLLPSIMFSNQALLCAGLWSTGVFANPLSAHIRPHHSYNKTICAEPGYNSSTIDNVYQLQKIERLAHGRVPSSRIPLNISSEGIKSLQLLAFNELFEIAFFSSLVTNISTEQPGFEVEDMEEKSLILETLTTIVAVSTSCELVKGACTKTSQQEELHYLTASQLLITSGHPPIHPCQYFFPTSCLDDAFRLAATFTGLLIGTLQDVIEVFAVNGDHTITRTIAAIIGEEAEQEAWYRLLQSKKLLPVEAPFATTSSRNLAFSALQQFVVPGSCSNTLEFEVFSQLVVNTKKIRAEDQYLEFQFDLRELKTIDDPSNQNTTWEDVSRGWLQSNNASLSLAYINQQQAPIIQPVEHYEVNAAVVKFQALLPFSSYLLYGLTVATIVQGNGPFPDISTVTSQTLFGPALLSIN
jgi:hypothetical protein